MSDYSKKLIYTENLVYLWTLNQNIEFESYVRIFKFTNITKIHKS